MLTDSPCSRWARGGRGGKIVKVTSLADNTNPGTLRYALAVETGPRTVVFDIGGVITLTSRLVVAGNYVTVAGQTAPGKGVIIQGWPVGLSGNSDVIFRHVRVRPGTASGQTIDGMGMAGANYAIFDRCSMVGEMKTVDMGLEIPTLHKRSSLKLRADLHLFITRVGPLTSPSLLGEPTTSRSRET